MSKTRNKAIQIRVNEDEYKAIENKAEILGITISDYMRMVCLHADIKVLVNLDEIDVKILD